MVVAHNKTIADVWDATWEGLPRTNEVVQNYDSFLDVPWHATGEPVTEFRVNYLKSNCCICRGEEIRAVR